MKKLRKSYHHGNLAESLLNAVDVIASRFGLEAVTLRACARHVGVSPSSAFRHFADKQALLTAFATRALNQLADAMDTAQKKNRGSDQDAFSAVGLAYIRFSIENPALFRAMWRTETIYPQDEDYVAAELRLGAHLKGGFAATLADADPCGFSPRELLAWSSVHGLASLIVDGPLGSGLSKTRQIEMAQDMLQVLQPALFST